MKSVSSFGQSILSLNNQAAYCQSSVGKITANDDNYNDDHGDDENDESTKEKNQSHAEIN